MKSRSPQPTATNCHPSLFVASSYLLDIQLPSAIPHIYSASRHHLFSKVDLRRAELALGLVEEDPLQQMTPLMDKVLVVPKSFIK